LSLLTLAANAQINITNYNVTYTENFNLLASSGESNVLPAGWSISETGTTATTVDGNYTGGTGSDNTGDTYSLGTTPSERALGTLRSSGNLPTIGALFVNSGTETIIAINIQYHGEQWRLGATGRNDRMDFQFSATASSLSTVGVWTDVDSLDFIAPISSGTTGAKDGNAGANSATVSSSITGLNFAPGGNLWIRWSDFDAASSDDALAVDDISITYVTVPEPTMALAFLSGVMLIVANKRRR
jgi:hypothetical protein